MVKMKVKRGDREFEFEGEKAEILEIYRELTQITPAVHVTEHRRKTLEGKRVMPNVKLPSDSDLIEYILSRPKYSHDIVEIQKCFFGVRMSSRANPSLYRRLANQLHRVRKSIEQTEKGEFETITGKAKNLKRYVFHPISSLEKVFG